MSFGVQKFPSCTRIESKIPTSTLVVFLEKDNQGNNIDIELNIRIKTHWKSIHLVMSGQITEIQGDHSGLIISLMMARRDL